MENTANISLEQIIKRRLDFYRNDKNPEMLSLNSGYVRGFTQMLTDMNLNEEVFTEKYINILQNLKRETESYEGAATDEDIDELCGYNNAIVDALSLLNIEFFYSIWFYLFVAELIVKHIKIRSRMWADFCFNWIPVWLMEQILLQYSKRWKIWKKLLKHYHLLWQL